MKTILLIESDDSLRRRFRKFLEFEGFRVIALASERAADEFLQNQPTEVDLVIVGTDRTTRSGDVANKIGTYLKALAAREISSGSSKAPVLILILSAPA